MFPIIDRRATGINLRKLMDERGDFFERSAGIPESWKCSEYLSLVEWYQYAND